MYALCTDDSILAGPSPEEIDDIPKLMREAKLDIAEEGALEDFLGVNINRKSDGTIHLTQPHLIDNILSANPLFIAPPIGHPIYSVQAQ